jgi:hypothetical protein
LETAKDAVSTVVLQQIDAAGSYPPRLVSQELRTVQWIVLMKGYGSPAREELESHV